MLLPHTPTLTGSEDGLGAAARRIGCAAGALLSALLLLSVAPYHMGWIVGTLLCAVVILSAWRPGDGLLVLAGLGPVATVLAVWLGADREGVRLIEALTLAFLAGAAARLIFWTRGPAIPARIAWPAVVLIVAALASAIVSWAPLRLEQPELAAAGSLPVWLARRYLVAGNAVTTAIQFAEGLFLFLVVGVVSARHPEQRDRLVRMIVAGATAAAAFNILRLVMVALRYEHAGGMFLNLLVHERVSAQFTDRNAAGSYFAMVLFFALALVARKRFAHVLSVIMIAAGLWVTGSRAALVSAAVVLVGSGLVAVRRRSLRRNTVVAAALAVFAAACVAAWMWYPAQRNDPVMYSIQTRLVLWRAAISMMRTQPFFGVGLGRYYILSHDYAGPTLESMWRPHENAHNYFVQVLAELGIPGLLLFLAVLGGSLREAWRGARAPEGLTAGLVAFLLTCLAGHPFLVPQVIFAFWIALALGATSGTLTPEATQPSRRWVPAAAACLVLLFLVTIPLRARGAVRHADVGLVATGLSDWQRSADGTRYRWAGAQSTFFYSAASSAVRIPLRPGPNAPSEFDVRIFFDGQEADRVRLHAGGDWRDLRLVRRRQGGDSDYFRIDLTATEPGGATPLATTARQVLMVGMPSIVWDR